MERVAIPLVSLVTLDSLSMQLLMDVLYVPRVLLEALAIQYVDRVLRIRFARI